MMSLAGLCILTGIVYGVIYLPLLVAPGLSQKGLKAFPRNIWVGGVLAAIAKDEEAFFAVVAGASGVGVG